MVKICPFLHRILPIKISCKQYELVLAGLSTVWTLIPVHSLILIIQNENKCKSWIKTNVSIIFEIRFLLPIHYCLKDTTATNKNSIRKGTIPNQLITMIPNLERFYLCIFIDPSIYAAMPNAKLLRFEPQSDFMFCSFNRIGTMANISTNLEKR